MGWSLLLNIAEPVYRSSQLSSCGPRAMMSVLVALSASEALEAVRLGLAMLSRESFQPLVFECHAGLVFARAIIASAAD